MLGLAQKNSPFPIFFCKFRRNRPKFSCLLDHANVIAAAAAAGKAHGAVTSAITHVAVTAVAIASGACLSTKVDFLWPKLEEQPGTFIVDGVDVTGYPIFNDEQVQKAIAFAKRAHHGQFRKTGDPYLTHCIHTGRILAMLIPSSGKRAVDTVVAGILHDVVDDACESLGSIKEEFGDEVAKLVAGVSRLSYINQLLRRHRRINVNQGTLGHEEANDLRVMLLGMVDDPRVVLIKLADRLHNMRTIYALPPAKARAVAQETLLIWCSLASRLGLWALKAELEDLCFAVLQPQIFRKMRADLASMWSPRNRVGYSRRITTIVSSPPLDERTASADESFTTFDEHVLSMKDLLEAVVPFDILSDCRKRTKFLHDLAKSSEAQKKAKVVQDAGIALTSLVACEEALEKELLISTSYIPGMEVTLSSRLKSLYSIFSKDLCSGKKIGSAREVDGLYYFEEDVNLCGEAQAANNELTVSMEDEIVLWHLRLGHPSFSYLQHLFPLLFKNKNSSLFQCEICVLSKHHRASFPSQPYKKSAPFSLIHSDIWGPSRVTNISGAKWFITFIDDHTRVCWVYLLKEKSETATVFKTFHTMIQTQFQAKIQVFRTDNGREYFATALGHYFMENGIVHQSSCVDTPQQNGVAERKNRHLLEVARSLMFTNRVPKQFWGEAILTASYLINRMPTRIFNFQSPLNVFTKFYPCAKVFTSLPPKIFGCIAFVYVHKQNRSKLDPRALKCVFLGYSPTQKGYKCYDPLSKKFFITMDVTFFENRSFFPKTSLQGEGNTQEDHFWELSLPMPIMSCVPPVPPTMPSIVNNEKSLERVPEPELQVYTRRNSKRSNHHSSPHCQDLNPNTGNLELAGNIHSNPISESVFETTNDLDVPIAQRKGTRSCTLHPISKYVSYHRLSPFFRAFTTNLSVIAIPKSVQDALSIPEWRDAVYAEMRALKKNKTWELVKLPEGKKPVGCKWIFTVKYRADGSLERYKARLVAKGFTQTYGIDYQETFAPVAKMNSIRVLLSLAANLGWQLQQLDVKNAFLNGELEEEVYMDLPPGFENEYGIGKVCKLKRSLYGLKQSPRAWFDRFTKSVRSFGYLQSQADHTMFFKHFTDGSVVIVIVYVDDIILTGSNVIEMENLKKVLAREFEMKDLGPLRYFLGMEIARSSKGIFVSQRKYTLDLLKETGMLGCKPGDTPIDPYHKLGCAIEGKSVDRESYQRLVGKLIYLSHTRPDIAFAVSVISQFMHSPCKEHLEAVYKVLKYLKKTPGKGLLFKKNNNLQVEVYTDADWAGSVIDRRSTSGYCTFVGGNLVTWRSKKQSVVARSSAEAEFRAVAHGICELLWLKKLLEELKIIIDVPMKLYCDNKAAINIAHNPVHHDRTKHVEVDRHFIKEKIESGLICMTFVPTTKQLADILTKGLHKSSFESLTSKLGMIDIFEPA